ncbi:MAG: DUF4397 domain-containing protein, partial [Armatimonadetes bacterium]|nr:DUF4397 domain-containing protein [Anaerolineae bacterium]
MRKLVLFLLSVLMLGVGLPAAAQNAETAFIRVGHFAADAPDVDIYLNGELSPVQALTYGSVSVWSGIPAGDYTVDVVPAGGALADSVFQAALVIEPATWTTVSAIGLVEDGTLSLSPAIEDYSTPIEAGEGRFSVFHAIDGMTGIDLVRLGTPLLSTITYPNAALGTDGLASVELAAGTFDFQLTGAGRASAVLIDLPEVVVEAGDYTAVFAYGTLEATLATVIVVTAEDARLVSSGGVLEASTPMPIETAAPDAMPVADGDPTFIRVGHFAADAPNVDVYLNGEISPAQDLAFTDVTAWVSVPAGDYVVDVVPAGETLDDSVSQTAFTLEPDTWTTLSAIRAEINSAIVVQPALEDYDTPIATGYGRFTVFHAIEGMSGIDLVRLGTPLISTIAYPDPALGNDG